jgi:hypothetical protein
MLTVRGEVNVPTALVAQTMATVAAAIAIVR